mgnify:CR=1 FL=1
MSSDDIPPLSDEKVELWYVTYSDWRCLNWLRICEVTGKVVVHNKKCDVKEIYEMPKPPSKEEVIWALKNPDTGRAMEITNRIATHPLWSSGKVLHRCPLCGYETSATNLHRYCPENPTEHAVPMYVVGKVV